MKIKIKKIIGCFFVVALITLNLIINTNSKENEESFSVKNLAALQASAGEATCDQSDSSSCVIEITTENGTIVSGKSTGKVVGSF